MSKQQCHYIVQMSKHEVNAANSECSLNVVTSDEQS